MAALKPLRARRWAVLLPVLIGALETALVVCAYIELPAWEYTNVVSGFAVSSYTIAFAAILATSTALCAWAGGLLDRRKVSVAIAVLWAVLIPVWFDGGYMYVLRRWNQLEIDGAAALAFSAMGLATAVALGWMTRSWMVGGWCGAVSIVVPPVYLAMNAVPNAWLATPFLWQIGTAVVLGQYLRAQARLYGPGRCPECGYVLSGLPAGALCPECGAVAGSAS